MNTSIFDRPLYQVIILWILRNTSSRVRVQRNGLFTFREIALYEISAINASLHLVEPRTWWQKFLFAHIVSKRDELQKITDAFPGMVVGFVVRAQENEIQE